MTTVPSTVSPPSRKRSWLSRLPMPEVTRTRPPPITTTQLKIIARIEMVRRIASLLSNLAPPGVRRRGLDAARTGCPGRSPLSRSTWSRVERGQRGTTVPCPSEPPDDGVSCQHVHLLQAALRDCFARTSGSLSVCTGCEDTDIPRKRDSGRDSGRGPPSPGGHRRSRFTSRGGGVL